MRRWRSRTTRGAATAALVALASGPLHAPPLDDTGIVIEHVTAVSPDRDRPLPDADVVIRNGRIAEIGTHLTLASHVRRIDGSGEFLIPGLIDSHVHVGHSGALDDYAIQAHPDQWASYRAQVPRAYLAVGFTSVTFGLSRDLGSIEVGKRADLVLLTANPLADVSAYDSIETVFLNGVPIARDTLAARR